MLAHPPEQAQPQRSEPDSRPRGLLAWGDLGIAKYERAFAPELALDASQARSLVPRSPLPRSRVLTPAKPKALRSLDGDAACRGEWTKGCMGWMWDCGGEAALTRPLGRATLRACPCVLEDRQAPTDEPIGRSYAPHRRNLWTEHQPIGNPEDLATKARPSARDGLRGTGNRSCSPGLQQCPPAMARTNGPAPAALSERPRSGA